ncbi:discoidin domain-containing protein [Streptomyces sp. NPDC094032]|uniref:discoidin domain-containing protein n=1 Tax=Streptomyces sp. NPDC094032 TaxID=3155308 RepID=UPI0033311B1A
MRDRTTPVRRTAAAGLGLVTVLAASATMTGASGAQAAAGSPGTVTIAGSCLDDANSATADGSVVRISACDGSAGQNWTWHTDGKLTVTIGSVTKCADITGGSNASGALVQLYGCTGVAQQKFAYLPDGTVYSSKSGKCLAVQGGSVTNGARVGLAPCDPAQAVQKWGATTAPKPRYLLSAGATLTLNNGADTPASVYTDADGSFWFQDAVALYGATEPRVWNFFSGQDFDTATKNAISTAADPANPVDRNNDTTWRCNNSPTGVESTYATGTGFSERNYCDLVGVWVDPDTGWWYGLVHNEFTPSPFGDGLHYDSIDYAVSKDRGTTWKIQDHALTSPYSTKRGDTAAFPKQTYYYGDGDPRLFVDHASGYFYVYYASRVVTKPGTAGGSVWQQHVARAPISGKMAAQTWQKWYDGAWTQPGVGGLESNIIPADGDGGGYTPPAEDYKPTSTGGAAAQVAAGTLPDHSQLTVMNIAWSAYLGKYIGTPQNNIAQNTGTGTPLHLYATDDLATQKWTDLGLVPGTDNAAWYRWLLDPVNRTSSTVLGRTFRSYCLIDCPNAGSEITVEPRSSADLPAPVTTGAGYRIATGGDRYLAQSGSAVTTGSDAQLWRFTATGDGFYTVTNAGSGLALGVAETKAGRAWGAAVSLGTAGSAPSAGRQWSVQMVTAAPAQGGASTPTGAYRLVNRYSGLALSLTAQSVATSPQRGWDNTGTTGDTRPAAAQQLTLTPAGGSANTVTVTPPADQSTPVGTPATAVQVQAQDSAPAQTLTYTASGLPGGLSLDPATGRVTGTPVTVGRSTVTVTVTDTTGASGSAVFVWTVTGTDLALGRPTTASSTETSGLTANLATDGKPTTRWASAYTDPQWLQVDLGTTRTITSVQLNWETAYGKAYQIQTSADGTNWTTVYSTTTGDGGTDTLTGLNTSGRYIRLYGTARGTGYGYSLWSFEAYGS